METWSLFSYLKFCAFNTPASQYGYGEIVTGLPTVGVFSVVKVNTLLPKSPVTLI